MHKLLERQLRKIGVAGDAPTAEQWCQLLSRVDAAYADADRDRYTLERALDLSSGEMRMRFSELRDAQKQLMAAARKAGMADVATSVLHNIGNVLNSVNTSATIVGDFTRSSSRYGLGKVLTLLQAQPEPGAFIDRDPKGQRLIPYLQALDKTLNEERDSMLREVQCLAKNIEHIKQIVAQQLAAAKGDGGSRSLVERVELEALFQDVISVASSTLGARQRINFVRELSAKSLETDHHKLFQIVMNLVANARDAVSTENGPGTIKISSRLLPEEKIAIEVTDDGAGIDAETLQRIFNHGFTTKPQGHGFGLHSSACAAIELGGTLTAQSDGRGCGATFRLVLPSGRPTRRSMLLRVPPPARPESAQ